jgi:hypothetical protein
VLIIRRFWIAGPGACRIRADFTCYVLRVSTPVAGVSLGRVWMWLTRPIPGRKLRRGPPRGADTAEPNPIHADPGQRNHSTNPRGRGGYRVL